MNRERRVRLPWNVISKQLNRTDYACYYHGTMEKVKGTGAYIRSHFHQDILIFRGAERILTVKIAAVAFDIYAFRPNKRNAINTRLARNSSLETNCKTCERAFFFFVLRLLPAYGRSASARSKLLRK